MRILYALSALVLATSVPAQTAARSGQAAASELSTVTIELKHLTPAEAIKLLKPYLRDPKASVVMSGPASINIKDDRSSVSQMQRVLDEQDRSINAVSLRFELVHATEKPVVSTTTGEPLRSTVDSVLRSVLRYEGYRVLGSAVASAGEQSTIGLTIAFDSAEVKYALTVNIGTIRDRDGTVRLNVTLNRSVPTAQPGMPKAYPMSQRETIIQTGLDVPIGQSVVLGTTAVGGMPGALVLVVRPELLPTVKRKL